MSAFNPSRPSWLHSRPVGVLLWSNSTGWRGKTRNSTPWSRREYVDKRRDSLCVSMNVWTATQWTDGAPWRSFVRYALYIQCIAKTYTMLHTFFCCVERRS